MPREVHSKKPFLSFFLCSLCPFPLLFQCSIVHSAHLYFYFSWFGFFPTTTSLFKSQAQDPEKVFCLALPKDSSISQPTEMQQYWLLGCINKGREPSMHSLISHDLSSLSCSTGKAVPRKAWGGCSCPRFLLVGHANCLICTYAARATGQHLTFIHATPSSAMSNPTLRNAAMPL